ncbi:MAG: AraC family transcriptional regulator [Methylobacteriaceae bacterium]|nr:AraC family transcriptional regulator [Methylobacteriaceae bacterium]
MGNSVLSRLRAHAPIMKTVSLPRGRHRLHTMPTSTGYEIRTEPTYDWNGRRRGRTPFTILQHTIEGNGNLTYERRRYRLGPGDTMLLIVPHDHRYWLAEGESWEFFWISMSGQEAVRIHRAVQATTGPVLQLRPETVEHLASCSLRLIEGEGETPGAASRIAYEAAMALYDDILGSQGASSLTGEDAAMRRVVEYINANLEKPLSVPVLAEVAGLSRAHFSRLFLASEGVPPAGFVLQERMRRAGRLLSSHARLPVKEIAILCGLDDPNYFAKVFRRFFGTSPTEFRTTGMYAVSGSEHAGTA